MLFIATYAIVIGWIATICTTIAFLPQVIKIAKTKEVSHISLPTFTLQSFGNFMWLLYGAFINDMPLLVGNAITLCLAITILCFKIIDIRKRKKSLNSS